MALRRRSRLLLALSIGVQVGSRSRLDAVRAAEPGLWLRSGALASGCRSASATSSRTSTGCAPSSITAASAARERRRHERELRSAVSAARPRDLARSALQGRVPVWRDLPDRGVSERARPARSRDRAAERGIEHDAAAGSTIDDIGFVYYWWLHDYAKAADWFKRGRRAARRAEWLTPLAATTLAEGGDRRSSRQLWTQLLETPTSTDIRNAGRAPAAAARCDGHDRRADARAAAVRRARAAARRESWQELAAAERLRGSAARSDRHAVCRRSGNRATSTSRRKSPLWPLPADTERQGRQAMIVHAVRCARRSSGSCIGSFLNVVIYRLPLGPVAGDAAVALPQVRLSAALVRQHSGPQLAVAARPLPQVRHRRVVAIPARRADHRRRCSCSSSG